MAGETRHVRVRIAGRTFVLRSSEVARAMRNAQPELVRAHYVVVAGRRFPPKQVISVVTGLERADFATHQARSTLVRLGFRRAVSVRCQRPARYARLRRGRTRSPFRELPDPAC